MDLVVNKFEIAIFPNDLFITDLAEFTAKIEKAVTAFNGTSTILPVPADAPREIPRIILRSKDGSLNCNISFDKINIFWLNKDEKSDFDIPYTRRQNLAEKLLDVLLNERTIKRVGLITEYYYETKDPIETTTNKVLQAEMIEDLKNFKVNFTYKKQLSAYANCNQVISIGNGIKTTGDKKEVLMISIDTNTSQFDNTKWDIQHFKQFLSEAEEEADKEVLQNKYIK